MAQLEYKCPCCGGAMAFDAGLQKIKCPYCDSEFEMDALKAYDNDLQIDSSADKLNWDETPEQEWLPGETDGMRVYICNSCGGEIICDENTAATSCPYCGNPVVMGGQFKGDLRPDLVIPFKIDKKQAKAALNNLYKGKRLLPKIFKDQNHIDEIKGVYVPFWLFDTEVNGQVRYKATRVRSWSDSNFNYTETSYFSCIRSGSVAFDHVPVDGSTKMDDALMESIEPFDYSGAVDFQTAYLAGYFADKYDVNSSDSIQRANTRVKKTTENVFASTVNGYASVVPEATSVSLNSAKAKYALYPVWLLNTSWNGNKYTFAVNGQTGKVVGDLPVDKAASRRLFAVCAAAGTAVCFALSYLLYLL